MPAVAIKTSAVLVVEDDCFLLTDIAATLREQGFEVLVAENAGTALQVLETRADIGVLVTDIEMPGMSGLQLSQKVRDRWPPVEIILISGHVSPNAAEMPQRSLFFSKPMNLHDLGKAIRGFGAQV